MLSRIPLRLAMLVVRPIALFSHRLYMTLLLPVLCRAGMTLRGRPRYIAPSVYFDDFDRITLGDRVVISSAVSLLTHDYSRTTLLVAAGRLDGGDEAVVRAIDIGDNVFIGRGSILLPGTTTGSNVIIGAGSVVRGHVPEGTVVLGNPAQVIGTIAQMYERRLDDDGLDIRKDA